MAEQNLFEEVKRHLCSCSADLQITPNLEAVMKMPTGGFMTLLPGTMSRCARPGIPSRSGEW